VFKTQVPCIPYHPPNIAGVTQAELGLTDLQQRDERVRPLPHEAVALARQAKQERASDGIGPSGQETAHECQELERQHSEEEEDSYGVQPPPPPPPLEPDDPAEEGVPSPQTGAGPNGTAQLMMTPPPSAKAKTGRKEALVDRHPSLLATHRVDMGCLAGRSAYR
jgi:hypothetical protein